MIGISDVRQIRNRLPIDQAVAAGALRAAFDGVTGNRSRRELIPIVCGPTEFVNHRAER